MKITILITLNHHFSHLYRLLHRSYHWQFFPTDPHGLLPCPGGGDQEARCLVGSVPHLRLDSCCGAHAGGRTLRKISGFLWRKSGENMGGFPWIWWEFMVDFMAKLRDGNWNEWWFHGLFLLISWCSFGNECDLMVALMLWDFMVIQWRFDGNESDLKTI